MTDYQDLWKRSFTLSNSYTAAFTGSSSKLLGTRGAAQGPRHNAANAECEWTCHSWRFFHIVGKHAADA